MRFSCKCTHCIFSMSFGKTHYNINFKKWVSIVICSSIYWIYLPFPGKVTTCMLTCFSEMTKNCQVIVSCCTSHVEAKQVFNFRLFTGIRWKSNFITNFEMEG